jgi:transcriptional regulator with XRE-family HTH domain
LCDHFYPGTREAFILVSQAPHTDRETQQRAELADFLRTRRNAITPERVGLPSGGRRRTPGLRREEVAQLAGVGTTWYTWLEQGRDIRASASVLDAISTALRLTPPERAHLFMLGRGEEVGAPHPQVEKVTPTVRRLIEHMGANPAFVIGRRWDYLAWNRALEVVVGDPGDLPEGRRNQIWATFMDPGRRRLFTDWPDAARNAVARFRADSAPHVGDPFFDDLIDELREASPEFRDWWQRHEVAHAVTGRKVLRHPAVGKMVFEHAIFKLDEAPEQRLVLYSPLPVADTAAKLERLLTADREP